MRRGINFMAGLILGFLLAAVITSSFSEEREAKDTPLLLAAGAALFIDYRQTLQVSRYPELYWERNPIMGRHPGRGTVNTYFLAAAVITAGIARALPVKYRRIFLGGVIGVEAITVAGNKSIGLRVAF